MGTPLNQDTSCGPDGVRNREVPLLYMYIEEFLRPISEFCGNHLHVVTFMQVRYV